MDDIVYNKHKEGVTNKCLLWSILQNIITTRSFTKKNNVVRSILPMFQLKLVVICFLNIYYLLKK